MTQPGSMKAQPRELISCHVAGQYFCIDIMAVMEIRGWTAATPLPHTAPAFQGVLNLRGAILPIVDLAGLLGLSAAATTKQNVIIVVEASNQTVGLLVDGVSDILTVTPDMVQPPPWIVTGAGSAIAGLVDIEGRLLTLLHLESLISNLVVDEAA